MFLNEIFDTQNKVTWCRFAGGEYAFMADFIPSEADEELIEKLAAYAKP